jgi:energy-coupling factor transporter ATP-binding protein EcfA2
MRPLVGRRIATGGGRARSVPDIGLLCQNPLDQLLTERVDDEVALGPRNWAVFDHAVPSGGLRHPL